MKLFVETHASSCVSDAKLQRYLSKGKFVKLLIITTMKDPLDTIIRERFQTFDYSLAIDVLIQQTTGK